MDDATVAEGQPTSPLTNQISEKVQDLDWTLAHFTFVADVTTLANECDIAHSPAMSVASCHRLPVLALAFMGDSPELLANYATFLAEPGNEVYLLVNEEQRAAVEGAFEVLEVTPEWQMVFKGTEESLDPGPAEPLTIKDIPAIQALAKTEGLSMLEKDPLACGPAFGVWRRRQLISMATTRIRVPGAAEIGNIVTHKDYRQQGYGSAVISALVKSLREQALQVFLMVYQTNAEAIRVYEKLGFEIVRPMYLMHCVIKDTLN